MQLKPFLDLILLQLLGHFLKELWILRRDIVAFFDLFFFQKFHPSSPSSPQGVNRESQVACLRQGFEQAGRAQGQKAKSPLPFDELVKALLIPLNQYME